MNRDLIRHHLSIILDLLDEDQTVPLGLQQIKEAAKAEVPQAPTPVQPVRVPRPEWHKSNMIGQVWRLFSDNPKKIYHVSEVMELLPGCTRTGVLSACSKGQFYGHLKRLRMGWYQKS